MQITDEDIFIDQTGKKADLFWTEIEPIIMPQLEKNKLTNLIGEYMCLSLKPFIFVAIIVSLGSKMYL